MRQRSSLICGNRLAPSPFVKLSAAMSEVDWYVNLIPLLDIWCSHRALTLMWRVLHAVSDPFRTMWSAAALSLDTSVSQLALIISEITIETFSPCWRASLAAINSASQVDLATRSCRLDRHWTRLPPCRWLEVSLRHLFLRPCHQCLLKMHRQNQLHLQGQ